MIYLNFSLCHYQGTSLSTDKKPHVHIIIIYLYCRKGTRRAFFIVPRILNLRNVNVDLWRLPEKIRAQFIINFLAIGEDKIISKTVKPKGGVCKLKGIPSMAWWAAMDKRKGLQIKILAFHSIYGHRKWKVRSMLLIPYSKIYPEVSVRKKYTLQPTYQSFRICKRHPYILAL